ncbi:MAG: helix-turn-helix domain-containing protein [Labilithrix sp.]|nr:helix-turn-helix domain-containing protein [Labilithrix sp.]MCW5814648.1 helix-turn-helix domain-containing protein [Labilithrix sp.]
MQRSAVGTRLGARIRARREARGWSQATLAEMVELTPNYIGILERGEALPTVQTLLVLGHALDATPTELLGDATKDGWLDKVVAIAVAIPSDQRPLALALLQAVVDSARPSRPSRATKKPKRR